MRDKLSKRGKNRDKAFKKLGEPGIWKEILPSVKVGSRMEKEKVRVR
jgi:hypothetical protein